MKRRWWVLLALVLVSTVLVYLPAIDGEFVFDDFTILIDPFVVNPLAAKPLQWLLSGRPVTSLTFALNQLAVGLDTRGWHLVNVAIHLGAVVLAFLFARAILARAGLSRPEGPALAAASLFALHPLQTESVAYIVQRAESLAAGLFLAGFLLLLARDRAAQPLGRHALLAGAMAAYVLGLGAKPIVATLPAAWLLSAALLPSPEEVDVPAWRRVWRRVPATLPAWALTAAAAAYQIAGTANTASAGYAVPGLSMREYVATELRVIPTYLRLLAWPSGQCVDWQFPVSHSLLEPAVLASAALLAAIAGAAIAGAVLSRGQTGDGPAAVRAASFGALFFLLVLSPSSSVVPLLDPLAEHRVYLPSLGIFLAASAAGAAVIRRLAPARRAIVGAAVTVALLAGSGFATARRSAVWRSALALWSDAAEKAPGKARVQFLLGQAYHSADLPELALIHYRRARELRGDNSVDPMFFLPRIVSALLSLERFDEARAEMNDALARTPRDPTLLALEAQVEYNAGRDSACEQAALAALAIQPWHSKALKFLGLLRMRQNNLPAAREAFRTAAATHAIDPYIYLTLGQVETLLGDPRRACAAYAIAVGQPGNSWASFRAAQARATLGCR